MAGLRDLLPSFLLNPPPASEAGTVDAAAVARVAAALAAQVAALSGGRLAVADIDPAQRLLDRGWVDSISLVELLVFVERTWGVKLAETRVAGRLGSIDALAEAIVHEGRVRDG